MDINAVINKITQSKTADIIKKVPRSHIVLLKVIREVFIEQSKERIEYDQLLSEYNKRAA